jgi:hypothetical protein
MGQRSRRSTAGAYFLLENPKPVISRMACRDDPGSEAAVRSADQALNHSTVWRLIKRRLTEELPMFTVEQYRARAIEYANLLKTAKSADEARDFQGLERSFNLLADNAQWLTDHRGSLIPRA